MSSCEKCWSDSAGDSDIYAQLVKSRVSNPCTLEEQAGVDAGECDSCKRKTIHQHTHYCINRECVDFGVTK